MTDKMRRSIVGRCVCASPATVSALALSLSRWAVFRCAGDWAVAEDDGALGWAAAAAGVEVGADCMREGPESSLRGAGCR